MTFRGGKNETYVRPRHGTKAPCSGCLILFCFCSRTAAPNRLPPQEPEILGQPPDGIGPVVESFTYMCYRLGFRVARLGLEEGLKRKHLQEKKNAGADLLFSKQPFRARVCARNSGAGKREYRDRPLRVRENPPSALLQTDSFNWDTNPHTPRLYFKSAPPLHLPRHNDLLGLHRLITGMEKVLRLTR